MSARGENNGRVKKIRTEKNVCFDRAQNEPGALPSGEEGSWGTDSPPPIFQYGHPPVFPPPLEGGCGGCVLSKGACAKCLESIKSNAMI